MPMPTNQFSLDRPRALLQMRHEHVIKLEPFSLVQRHDRDGMTNVGGLQACCRNLSFKPVQVEAKTKLLGLTQSGQKRLDAA